jgi:hypothetical protein
VPANVCCSIRRAFSFTPLSKGYGVYSLAAPHRSRSLADRQRRRFHTRAAAPGSLLSVIGGRVSAARAGGLSYPVLAASDNESQIQVPFQGPTQREPNPRNRVGRSRRELPIRRPVSPAIMVGRDGVPMIWTPRAAWPSMYETCSLQWQVQVLGDRPRRRQSRLAGRSRRSPG